MEDATRPTTADSVVVAPVSDDERLDRLEAQAERIETKIDLLTDIRGLELDVKSLSETVEEHLSRCHPE